MVRTQAFHAWDAGFNSRGSHLSTGSIMDRIFDYESKDTGSNPI